MLSLFARLNVSAADGGYRYCFCCYYWQSLAAVPRMGGTWFTCQFAVCKSRAVRVRGVKPDRAGVGMRSPIYELDSMLNKCYR